MSTDTDRVSRAVGSGRIRATTWGGPRDREALQQLAEQIAQHAGFKVCAIEVLRSDDMLEFVAIHGSPEGAERLMGQGSPLSAIAAAFNCGATVGDLTFVAAEWLTESAMEPLRVYGHVPDLPDSGDPRAWRSEDMLGAHLYDERGQLRSVLYLDEPLSGRRLSMAELEQLSDDLQLAFRAVVTTVEREAYAQHARLIDAARRVVREASNQVALPDLLRLASAELGQGFRARRVYLYMRGDETHPAVLEPREPEYADREALIAVEAAAATAWRHGQVLIAERDQLWGADDLDDRHAGALLELVERARVGSLVVVPVGGAGRLLGAMVIVRDPNAYRWTDSESTAALEVGKDLCRAVLSARTLEREQELNRQLRELDDYRMELIRTVSHELKNPIGVILGHAEMLEASPELGDRARASVRAMERGAARLEALADDLLVLSQLGTPDHPLDLAPVRVDLLLQEAAEFLEVQAAQHQVRIDVLDSGEAPVVMGDHAQLQRLVGNLASNAVKYSRPGGAVRLSVEVRGDEVILVCADDGLGISEEDQERLFEEFFRSTNVEALQRPGTGLGLAIVERIVYRHDGTLGLESRLGVGTTFRVALPVDGPVPRPR